MNFISFQNTFRDFTLFSVHEIEKAFPGFDRKILVMWQKKGYLRKIRNSWYCLEDRLFKEDDLYLAANKIYRPSYVSLESALAYYQFIPEGVFRTTSVSTLKTIHFETPVGYFEYRNIKRDLFWGYTLQSQIHANVPAWYKIASPEKAIIDFLYLNPHYDNEADLESLRFDWQSFKKKVNIEKLKAYLQYISSEALTSRTCNLLNLFYAQS